MHLNPHVYSCHLKGADLELMLLHSQVVLVASTILMGVWFGVYRGGYEWSGSDPSHQFNFHPLFTYIGMVFLYGNGQ